MHSIISGTGASGFNKRTIIFFFLNNSIMVCLFKARMLSDASIYHGAHRNIFFEIILRWFIFVLFNHVNVVIDATPQ
jgi:hypothetical protein